MSSSHDRTASLMTPAKLAQVGAARAQVSPSAYLDQMAADVGHQHVKRLAELRIRLQEQAGASQAASIQPALLQFAQALPALDFALLETRGFWAGVTGKSREAGAQFGAQFARLEQAAKTLAGAIGGVQKEQQPHAAASDRSLVEFEVEYKALDGVIDQGARWLQDIRSQLKERHSQAQSQGDATAQDKVREDAARCEILVGRLKALRAAAAASQQTHQIVRATAQRRAALMQGMHKLVAGEVKTWQASVSRLAAAGVEGKSAGAALEGPREAHADLQKRVQHLLADCEQLQADEQALLRSLEQMGSQLASAA